MKKPILARAGVVAVVAAALGLWGCPNPNAIGVQQYGTVQAACVQANNGQPVSGAIVTVAGAQGQSTQTTDASGNATLTQVPIGTHVVSADAPGLHGEAPATIVENQVTKVRIAMSPT